MLHAFLFTGVDEAWAKMLLETTNPTAAMMTTMRIDRYDFDPHSMDLYLRVETSI